MTQLEIFETSIHHFRKVGAYIIKNRTSTGKAPNELEYMVVSSIRSRLGGVVEDFILEDSFCIFCLYSNISGIRKGLHRYISIEKEMEDEIKEWLTKMIDDFNSICIYIKSNYKEKEKGCRIIKNEARVLIKNEDAREFLGNDDID